MAKIQPGNAMTAGPGRLKPARRLILGVSAVLLPLLSAAFLLARRNAEPRAPQERIAPATGGTADCTVRRIVDGDTFVCADGTRVRLLLLDAEEAGQSEWADSATAFLESTMPPGSRVRLEFDVQPFDRFGRALAHVYAGSLSVNRQLLRRGLAHVAVHPPNVRMVEELRAAADSARRERRGIWASGPPACRPAQYRAGECR
jgi:micrococcal nuclease